MRKIKQAFLGVSLFSLLLSVPVFAEGQATAKENTQNQTNASNVVEIQSDVQIPTELLHSELRLKNRQQEESSDITSSDDSRRIPALEKEYGIEITESMHWSVKYPNYTPMATLKELGYYHVNANRQNLIMYGIQKNDWQPYRAFEAKQAPLYFEIVDGKFEYSKIYWGNTIENMVMSYRFDLMTLSQGGYLTNYSEPQTVQSLTAFFNTQMKEYVEKFKAAKGYAPYVIGLNSTAEYAAYWGVDEHSYENYGVEYSHPDVKAKGTFGKK